MNAQGSAAVVVVGDDEKTIEYGNSQPDNVLQLPARTKTGAGRARDRLVSKLRANQEFYAELPPVVESRQVRRRREFLRDKDEAAMLRRAASPGRRR